MMPTVRAATVALLVAEISTGIRELVNTRRLCDPSIMPRWLRRPCDAMKIKSQWIASATSTIARCGELLTVLTELQGTPSARAAASAFVNSSTGRPSNE